MITCLAGGVGAAKLIRGLVEVFNPEEITIIVNTADDIEMYGLYISPDVDIIMYTLANIVDKDKGWGIEKDTFNCLEMINKYGFETWFKLGDRDLATHIIRTFLMKKGLTLCEITKRLCKSLGVKAKIIPMTNDHVETRIVTNVGDLHFQEYLVKRKMKDEVLKVYFKGIEKATPSPGVIESIMKAKAVIICPSNPIVSIGPILSLCGVKDALINTRAKTLAVSPIVGGKVLKGPADKLMKALGIEVSAYGVAKLYKDFLDLMIIDNIDSSLKERIEKLGIKVYVTNTIMKTLEDKVKLAKFIKEVLEKEGVL